MTTLRQIFKIVNFCPRDRVINLFRVTFNEKFEKFDMITLLLNEGILREKTSSEKYTEIFL